jgi:hypothetical protein
MVIHGPHRKLRVQQFYCSVSIRYSGNVFTKPLPSNTQTYRLMEVIYEAVEMGPSAIIYKFHTDWFRR